MPPTTRSRGVPPPSRVYNSTTTPQQAQFPPRRKVVRTYGKQNRRTPARTLRQQTLTQIDFVSSADEEKDPIVLSSDSEDMEDEEGDENAEVEDEDDDDEDKENRPMPEPEVEVDEDETEVEAENDENEQPVSSGRKRRSASKTAMTENSRAKRRRTMGDDSGKKKKKKKNSKSSRRKTVGDAPSSGSGSSYHTQTLTQFLGRGSGSRQYVGDSEDEDDGFQDWLQDPASPTPKRNMQPSRSPLKTLFERERTESRQSSVVPQTPSRPPRDEIPSSSQASTPMSTVLNHQGNPILQDPSSSKIYSSPSARPAVTPSKASSSSSPLSTLRSTMMYRYGPPNLPDPSPSQRISSPLVTTPVRLKLTGKPKPKPGSATPKLEIQDTFATESWGSVVVTPTPQRQKLAITPQRAKTPTRESSSLDDEEVDTPTKPRQRRSRAELGDEKKTKTPTPRKMKKMSPHKSKKVMLEIPDSDEEEEGFDSDDDGGFVAGPETQFVMNEIASSEEEAEAAKAKAMPAPPPAPTPAARVLRELKSSSAMSTKPQRHATSSPSVPSSQPTSPALPSSPPKTKPVEDTRPRLRKPLHQPTQAPVQTQPIESQRVPLATLQALPPASFRTDILLPVPADTLSSIIGGYEVAVTLSFKIPVQVVRFWLFDGEWLRYMACADAGEPEKGTWRYNLSQVYELNNPLEDSDMREEGWLEGNPERYIYIPPAVVGQLLWNLRHALFKDGGSEETQSHELEQPSSPLSGGQSKNQPPTPTPNLSVSQQVEAQLQSDIAHSTQFPTSDDILVPSTPEEEDTSASSTSKSASKRATSSIKPPPSHLTNPPTSYRASRPPLTRPSQATTASQASTPEKHSHSHSTFYTRPPHHSSSSIVFESIGDSSPIRMPQSVPMGSSQLLTKSQMLPDSLVQDDARVPPEIWDSDEDADTTL